jgi:hypothetical protein
MAGSQKTFTWQGGRLETNLKQLMPQTERRMVALTEYFATKVESVARQNAPWTDRTGNARQGLFTKTFHEPFKSHAIVLAHSVPYGIWLEVRWSGKYAVIDPTIQSQGRAMMAALETIFAGGSVSLR